MYRMKAPNNVAAPVRGQLLKLTLQEKQGLAPFIPNGRTKASEESTKTRPLERKSDVTYATVSRDFKTDLGAVEMGAFEGAPEARVCSGPSVIIIELLKIGK
ncbi:hypothetical protein K3495_g12664 [Podosphaera aphanis]|nr:hypothetical protein K3495_g12664 [Podosphaera aphanis]